MPRKLSAEQIAGYERDGYVCPVDAFFARAGARMARAAGRLRTRRGPQDDARPQFQAASAVSLGRRDRACARGARRGRGPDRAGHPPVPSHRLAQGCGLRRLCELAPGRDLFRARTGVPCHRLGGADRRAGRVGLHGSGARLAQAGPAAACRDAGPREPAVARPDPGGRRRSHEDGLHAGEGGPVLAASHASGAQFAAQPLARPAHRARHQLHPDLGALHLADARHRHAGARRGQVRTFRRRAAADRTRPARRSAPSMPRRWHASGR